MKKKKLLKHQRNREKEEKNANEPVEI